MTSTTKLKKEIKCPYCQYQELTVYFDKETRRSYFFCPQCQTERPLNSLKKITDTIAQNS